MQPVTIPDDLFVLGEFYPFSSETKQALPFWYAGHFFGMVFQRAEYWRYRQAWAAIQRQLDIKPGEICYALEFTRIEHEPTQKRSPTPYHFASWQEVTAARQKAGLMGPAYLMFALQEILLKHDRHYRADRYVFLSFSDEVTRLYRFLIRTGMTYPHRHYTLIHHAADKQDPSSYDYFEVVKKR